MIIVNDKCFMLQGKNTSYMISVDEHKVLYHLYYGKKLSSRSYSLHRNLSRGRTPKDRDYSVPPVNDVGWLPKDSQGGFSLDELPQEYPAYGHLDLRTPAYQIETESGHCITDLRYESYQIIEGKPELKGLPAVYDNNHTAQTLIITLVDEIVGVKVELSYTVFDDSDVICRNTKFINTSKHRLILHRALSANVDFVGSNYEAVYLAGGWAREYELNRRPIGQGKLELSNARGGSGHQMNPFVILCDENTTETNGDAYGFSLVYSGNHSTVIEVDQYNMTRVQMGINPFTFQWNLGPSETFQTPECVLSYSDSGLGNLSRTYHDLYRNNLVRGTWKNKERPILINNWEATYFDFTEAKIMEIASRAQEAGIELFVLDDGWFGKRNTDHCSLGDWNVNTDKIPNGIDGLAKKSE
ncbi:glycoside hydrolase family 36 N-terminal domain-containing protein [Virgibacillus halophilus]|uniref:alpha-galactosidase n=1 Tax=Tigheibacillus halophilus TaxID=361280 RepID=A0ABU5C5I5_9BACI|nr:glycoside hydrolase family 36 N-terminal domain-containing protein [Virgibacillus halophilus]